MELGIKINGPRKNFESFTKDPSKKKEGATPPINRKDREMKNTYVYIHRYENLNVYSTARKVLESLMVEEGWYVYGDKPKGDNILICEETITKLITKLNKDGFLQLYSGSENSWIEKEMVI